ncbi:alpha-galactosidase [Agreia sp. Leaf335]|uniref:alpha-galactosidase n=1 Tax=Agreia sp. Leaf335 TaxID=1736340 RepID=UPI0006FC5AE7|nr:alpha-galactosidase [Agreia sp. Leaf335]KQR24507.1 alpha-galactosidase [Agreia sp. Leaf335]
MIHHLRAAGTSFVLDARGTAVPAVIHFGADLGELDQHALQNLAEAQRPAIGPSSIDSPLTQRIVPLMADGWSGRPGLAGYHEGTPISTLGVQHTASLRLRETRHAGLNLSLVLETIPPVVGEPDATALVAEIDIEMSAQGVVRQRLSVRNEGSSVYSLASLDATLPVPARARELLDFTGRWPRERQPQRHDLGVGTWTRDSRHGRPGHDAAFLLVAGTPGFGFRHGEIWGSHLAWSGDQRLWAEASATGHSLVGAGELIEPGEVRLATGETYRSPWLVSAWSANGLDGLAERLHGFLRSKRPLGERKLMLNTWEAVYFDHDLAKLTRLAETAASVGVERFVLDDGWMTGRTDDRRALGDWVVDASKWPDGLHTLIERVHGLGMDFGLWVEPEMVSVDSDVFRAHPEWVLSAGNAELPQSWRFQQALDLSNPEAFAHVLGQLSALLDEYPIAYLKWDQNRDLLGGSAHRQTLACYRLMDALRAQHPTLEIESCSSGGARVDLGVLERTDRVWPSDTNDSLERQSIYRYTAGLVPPEFLGVHLGAPTAHTTGRSHELSFRLATALFGHAGIEWDLTTASETELDAIRVWASLYREQRALLHSGVLVRADDVDPARQLHGIVAADAMAAIFSVVTVAATRDSAVAPVRFPGLHPDLVYRVRAVKLGEWPRVLQDAPPPWWVHGGVTLSGRVLGELGLTMPLLLPEQALVLHLAAV